MIKKYFYYVLLITVYVEFDMTPCILCVHGLYANYKEYCVLRLQYVPPQFRIANSEASQVLTTSL